MDSWAGYSPLTWLGFSPEGARDCREKAARTVINYLVDGELKNCVNTDFFIEDEVCL